MSGSSKKPAIAPDLEQEGRLGRLVGSTLLFATLIFIPVNYGMEEPDLVEFSNAFSWYGEEMGVNFSRSLSTFIYSSAAWPLGKHVYDCDAFFLYYEDDLQSTLVTLLEILNTSNTDIYVVLDPDPPSPGTTFLDLYYDVDLREGLIDDIDMVIENLSELGVYGYVIGDEWPRGLNSEEITVDLISRHNQTYRAEKGLWMRSNPGDIERISLVEWFYNRSISAWNMIVRELRKRHPDARLGTNIDLFWRGDLSHTNLAHWKSEGLWNQVDLDLYDFTVTHYFTYIDWEDDFFNPSRQVDIEGLRILEESLEELRRYLAGNGGPEIFLLLGAHCVYPRAKTPMQMILEWNMAMNFNDFLSGIGWFIFDLWISNDGKSIESISLADTIIRSPMKMDRLSTLKFLLDNPLRHTDIPEETSNFDVVWLRSYSSSANTIESCMAIDNGGYQLIAGTLTTSSGSSHAYLLELDRNGDQVWSRTYPGAGTDRMEGITLCREGGFALVGTWGEDSGIFTLRTDFNGSIIWEARYCIEGIVDLACVVQDGEGSFIVSGTLSDEMGTDAFAMKILPSSELGWLKSFDSGLDDNVNWFFEGDGCYYLVGDARDQGGQMDMLVTAIDHSGQAIWTRTYGGAGMDSASYGLVDGETIIIAGRGQTRGYDGPYLLGIDAGGNVILDRIYQWDGVTIRGMVPSPKGGYLAIGRGGTMLKLDENWNRVWDRGWEPVGPDASMSSNGDGYYLITGSLSGKIRAVKVWEPVVEFPTCLLPALLILPILASSKFGPEAPC